MKLRDKWFNVDSTPPALFHQLQAVAGWIELGDRAEAARELNRVPPEFRFDQAVLETHWLFHASAEDWAKALDAARELLTHYPEEPEGWLHQAYAVRRIPGGGLEQAWDALKPAMDQFPNEPVIPYNLACYACQLGRLKEARHLLDRAMQAGEPEVIRQMAVRDIDLEPLWPELQE